MMMMSNVNVHEITTKTTGRDLLGFPDFGIGFERIFKERRSRT